MSISKQADDFHNKFRAMAQQFADAPPPPPDAPFDITPMRNAFAAISASFGTPVPHKKEVVNANGTRAVWFTADGATGDTVILYTHGGGLISCSAETHTAISSHLSKRLNGRTLGVDYRLAPENSFPTQIEDSVAAYKWLLDQGVKPGNIVFAGDSAGGALVITTQLLAKQKGLPMPAAAFVISPWIDLEATSNSYRSKASVDLCVSAETTVMSCGLIMGANKFDRSNPLMSPLNASLKGLAPAIVQVGGDEVLEDESRQLVENLKRDGVEAVLEVIPHMQHIFQADVGIMPEADAAVDRAVAFLKKHLKK